MYISYGIYVTKVGKQRKNWLFMIRSRTTEERAGQSQSCGEATERSHHALLKLL